jgi:uncharacterized protein (TIGR02147 family)
MTAEYVDLLIREYVSRKQMNARYSERAFAQMLGLSPGFLKLLFQGKKQLGIERAKEVASRLNLKDQKRVLFLRSVQKSRQADRAFPGKFVLKDHDFDEISDWFAFATLELIKVKKGKATESQISECLGISKTETIYAIKSLTKLGILKKQEDGSYHVPESYEMPSISSGGIRRFHRQMFQLANLSIDGQSAESRDLRGLTLAFEKSRISEAQKEIQKFVAQFEKKFGSGNFDSVYQLSLAFFQLDRGNS